MMILSGYAALQLKWLHAQSIPFLLLNAAGSGTLAVIAAGRRSWGFLLLNVVWTVISVIGLVRRRGIASAED